MECDASTIAFGGIRRMMIIIMRIHAVWHESARAGSDKDCYHKVCRLYGVSQAPLCVVWPEYYCLEHDLKTRLLLSESTPYGISRVLVCYDRRLNTKKRRPQQKKSEGCKQQQAKASNKTSEGINKNKKKRETKTRCCFFEAFGFLSPPWVMPRAAGTRTWC